MPGYPVEGIIIKRSDYKEADRLLTLYTKDHGKLTVIAKGVRRPTSKRAGSLELFNHIQAYITPGHGSLETLTEVKLLDTFPAWRNQLGRVALAYQCIEAIDKLTPDRQPQTPVFDHLLNFLHQVGSLGIDWRKHTLDQMKNLLEMLGYFDPAQPPANVYQHAEEVAGRPLYSSRLITRLSQK